MTVAELLQDDIFNLPVSWVGFSFTDSLGEQKICRSYHQFVIRRLSAYMDLLDRLDDIEVMGSTGSPIRLPPVSNAEEVRRAVKVLCRGILATLKAYAEGSPSRAYAQLSQALEPHGGAGLLQAPAVYFETQLDHPQQVYYRLRISEDEPVTQPREMFHLPFQLRWKTKGYRFSIAGYPSMYAGTSPLLALHEMRLSAWNDHLYAVKLRTIPRQSMELPIRDVRLFNLRNQIEEFRRRYARPGPYDGQIMKFLVRWPLIMATSVPVGHPESDKPQFHEEYVLPQLLLEWVNNVRGRDQKITGIAFSSSRVEAKALTDAGHFNIVVPAESPVATGLCAVRIRQFEITAPVAVSSIRAELGKDATVDEIAQRLDERLSAQDYHRLHID